MSTLRRGGVNGGSLKPVPAVAIVRSAADGRRGRGARWRWKLVMFTVGRVTVPQMDRSRREAVVADRRLGRLQSGESRLQSRLEKERNARQSRRSIASAKWASPCGAGSGRGRRRTSRRREGGPSRLCRNEQSPPIDLLGVIQRRFARHRRFYAGGADFAKLDFSPLLEGPDVAKVQPSGASEAGQFKRSTGRFQIRSYLRT